MFSGCIGQAADACTCYRAVCLCTSDPPRSGTTSSSAIYRRQFRVATASSFMKAHFTNHESLPSLFDSFSQFIRLYPRYPESDTVDKIRDEEYYNLKKSNKVCLDYNGIGLFSYSQVHDQESSNSSYLSMPIFNISCKSTSLKMQLLHGCKESVIESTMKRRILDYLSILDDEYSMVFTANRASAFKLLAESYPFQSSTKLLTVYDYKSEAVGQLASSALKRGAKAVAAEFVWPTLKIYTSRLKMEMVNKSRNRKKKGLLAFPLQSRVTGSRYQCLWMRIARENGWHVLLDACALGPKEMKCFGLSLCQPDFIICSFYKIFGDNPSGFGCLFVKKSTIPILETSTTFSIVSLVPPKTFTDFQSSRHALQEEDDETSCSFSGPIVVLASESGKLVQGVESISKQVEKQAEELHTTGISLLEEKTTSNNTETTRLHCKGLDHVDTVGLGMIESRARFLINWLVTALRTLHHPNTQPEIPLVRIYGPKIKFDRSPALAFNIFDWNGAKFEPNVIQKLADRRNISISSAFLQHIWLSDKHRNGKARIDEEAKRTKHEKDTGIPVVTIALGFLTNFEDAYRLWAFVAQFLNADFVEKERWRYTSLNQNTVEI